MYLGLKRRATSTQKTFLSKNSRMKEVAEVLRKERPFGSQLQVNK